MTDTHAKFESLLANCPALRAYQESLGCETEFLKRLVLISVGLNEGLVAMLGRELCPVCLGVIEGALSRLTQRELESD